MRKKGTKAKKARKPMSPKKKRILTILLSIILIGVLVGLICFGYIVANCIKTVNGDRIIDLEFYKQNQDQTTIIYAYDKENKPVELVSVHGEENRVWVSNKEMSPWVGKAFVALEDKRFREHHGVDWVRTVGGVVKSRFRQGGSTITQQLIKNLTGENGRTINRKYNEILSALNTEKYYSKDTILEAYLNTIYLSHGCYGVKTAAETYFGKDVSQLNAAEAASLAAITQEPATYDPFYNLKKNKERQELCLWYMHDQGMLSDKEYKEALDYKLIFTNSEDYVEDTSNKKQEKKEENEVWSYYIDYVISSVISDLKKNGYSNYEATKMVYSGGLRIYSAVDTEIQDMVEDIYVHRTGIPTGDSSKKGGGYQSAITIMDYEGRVVAICGGAGEKKENRSNNRATSAIRQPGSSIKPLTIYAPAMEEGIISWGSMIKNYGITWNGKVWPTNYGGNKGSPTSYVSVQYALSISYNTVPAQILMMMGFDTSWDYVTNRFHISTLNPDIDAYAPSSLATGGTSGGVTTLEMAAAFCTFGNGGKYYKPYCYYKITDSTGEEIILQHNSEDYEQAISPDTAYVMNQLCRTVYSASSGTAKQYKVKNHVTYGKTGTSSSNFDRWCIGGTPYYLAAVWFGYDYNKQITAQGNPAGSIFKLVMDKIHSDLTPKDFEKFSDKAVQRAYCTGSGLLAGSNCASKSYGWYRVSKLPGVCSGACYVKGAEPPEEELEEEETTKKTDEEETTKKKKAEEETTKKKAAEETTKKAAEPTTSAPPPPDTTAAPPPPEPPVTDAGSGEGEGGA